MHMFFYVMKGIQPFAANLLSYIATKYYYNWSQWKPKGQTFLKHSVVY